MSKTPLCDRLAGPIAYEDCVKFVREHQEASLAYIGRGMMDRLNDRQALIDFTTRAGLISSNGAEFADHIRAYILTGRKPWKT